MVLARGIGANTTIISVVNTVRLKPVSYPNGERIVYRFNSAHVGFAPRLMSSLLYGVGATDPAIFHREHAAAGEHGDALLLSSRAAGN